LHGISEFKGSTDAKKIIMNGRAILLIPMGMTSGDSSLTRSRKKEIVETLE